MTTELLGSSASKREAEIDIKINSKHVTNVDDNVIGINDDGDGNDEYSLCLSMTLITNKTLKSFKRASLVTKYYYYIGMYYYYCYTKSPTRNHTCISRYRSIIN